MAPNSLSPASVVIDYHSLYGAHKMTIPTKEWFPVDITGNLGSYEGWDSFTIDAEAMVLALVAKLKTLVTATAAFDQATVFTQATPTSPNIPQRTVSLGITGTSTNTAAQQAVSQTWNFKTTANGNSKLILLDTPLIAWLARVPYASMDALQLAVSAEFMATNNAWAGRDDAKPNVCRAVTWDINDKLQKQYFG